MWPVLVVPGEPSRQVVNAVIGRRERDGVGPFAEHGLDEALRLTVGFGRVGECADVPDAQQQTPSTPCSSLIALGFEIAMIEAQGRQGGD